MKLLKILGNVLLVISLISVALLAFDFFVNGGNFIGTTVPNSIDEFFILGPIIALVLSVVIKIFIKVFSERKYVPQPQSGLELKKTNISLTIGLVFLSIVIHVVYLFFTGMSCGFGYDKFFCDLIFPVIGTGFIISVITGVMVSKTTTPKRIILYIMANITAVIIAMLIDPNYFNM